METEDRRSGRRRLLGRRAGLAVLALGLAALAGAGYVFTANRPPAGHYRTAGVDRGTIVTAVSTTGTLNAVTTVQVGSQVSGQIQELLADFNTQVRKGQLVARLAPEIFQAKVDGARADLESAEALVLNQRANVERVHAEVEQARAALAAAEAQIARAGRRTRTRVR